MKWDMRYMALAKEVSTWSKDPSTQVGTVAVGSKGQVLSQGYNGFPRGVDDDISRLEIRETKYKYVVHAEMNCTSIFSNHLNLPNLNLAETKSKTREP